MKSGLLALCISLVMAVGFPAYAGAAWSNYTPASTYFSTSGSTGAVTGSNYWTNNRVYKPTGNYFYLGYNDGSYHYSADDDSTDPFAFPSYGYNYSFCEWDWQRDRQNDPNITTVGPLTCQIYI